MRLAIVGSVSLWGDRRACDAICEAIDRLQPKVVVSGGAMGVDKMAALIAWEVYECEVVEYLPASPRWAPHGYQERNLLIAGDCDHLLRVAAKNSKTYGSGWTRDRAKERGVPCEEVVL